MRAVGKVKYLGNELISKVLRFWDFYSVSSEHSNISFYRTLIHAKPAKDNVSYFSHSQPTSAQFQDWLRIYCEFVSALQSSLFQPPPPFFPSIYSHCMEFDRERQLKYPRAVSTYIQSLDPKVSDIHEWVKFQCLKSQHQQTLRCAQNLIVIRSRFHRMLMELESSSNNRHLFSMRLILWMPVEMNLPRINFSFTTAEILCCCVTALTFRLSPWCWSSWLASTHTVSFAILIEWYWLRNIAVIVCSNWMVNPRRCHVVWRVTSLSSGQSSPQFQMFQKSFDFSSIDKT